MNNTEMYSAIEKRILSQKRAKRRIAMLCCVCALVVGVTGVLLIMPADTQSQETFCGFEEHTHSDECYETIGEKLLICTIEEGTVTHEHADACYEEQQNLICTLKETAGHTHTDACYEQQAVLSCGQEETSGHAHTDACYTHRQVLSCALPESAGHMHDAACYDAEGNLICTVPEGEGAHSHDASCYTEETSLICGMTEGEGAHTHSDACYMQEASLICGQEEEEAHQHTDTCYEVEKVLTCTESTEPHVHSDACYYVEKVFTCDKPEHEHTLKCFANPTANLENPEIWERPFQTMELTGNWREDVISVAQTQLGYTESSANYIVDEFDDTRIHGYTRYGAWYGYPYSEWCAMFCSFVYHYAEVDSDVFPCSYHICTDWVDALTRAQLWHSGDDYIPQPGDLIFFDTEKHDGLADHVGLVYNWNPDTGLLTTIEGNRIVAVDKFDYYLTDDTILGFGELPENPELAVKAQEELPAPTEAPAEEAEPVCTCGAEEGQPHAEDCPLYVPECTCGAEEGEEHTEDCPVAIWQAKKAAEAAALAKEAEPVCTCGAEEGQPHAEDCPLFVPECTCGAAEGEEHAEDCPVAIWQAKKAAEAAALAEEAEPTCTCGAEEGQPHAEDCPLYMPECTCGADEGEEHAEDCPVAIWQAKKAAEAAALAEVAEPTCICGAEEGQPHAKDCPLYVPVPITVESSPAEDGTVVSVTGYLPEDTELICRAAFFTGSDLLALHPEERISSQNALYAYELKAYSEGKSFQPDSEMEVCLPNPCAELAENEVLALAAFDAEAEELSVLSAELTEEGELVFTLPRFCTVIVYTYSVEYPVSLESAPAEDGAIAKVHGYLPEDVSLILECATYAEEELASIFPEDTLASMNSFAAYNIHLMQGEAPYLPEEALSVSLEGAALSLAEDDVLVAARYVPEEEDYYTLDASISELGTLEMETNEFGSFLFYTYTDPTTTIMSAPASDGAVAVIRGILPEGATAEIEAVELTREEMIAYFGERQAAAMKSFVAYDIKIMVNGEEWQPDDTVSVVVEHPALEIEEEDNLAIAHVDGETEEVSHITADLNEQGEIIFDTEGFSLYIFYTFTVDFHFGTVTFSIEGRSEILLSELFEELGVERSVTEVAQVRFSDPTLLEIEQIEGDWILRSLQPFTSDEELTILFNDGEMYIITVTDAQTTYWEPVTSIDNTEAVYLIVRDGHGYQYALTYGSNTSYKRTNLDFTVKNGVYSTTAALTNSYVSFTTAVGTGGTTGISVGGHYLNLGDTNFFRDSSRNIEVNYLKDKNSWSFKRSGGDNYLYYHSLQSSGSNFAQTTDYATATGSNLLIFKQVTGEKPVTPVDESEYYRIASNIDAGKEYLIVSAEGNYALKYDGNLSAVALDLQPQKASPTGVFKIEGVTNQMLWKFSSNKFQSKTNNKYLSLNNSGNLTVNSTGKDIDVSDKQQNVRTIMIDDTSYLTLSGNSFSTTSDSGKIGNKMLLLEKTDKPTPLGEPAGSAGIGISGTTAHRPDYPDYLPTSPQKTGDTAVEEIKGKYYSDPSTTQIESILTGKESDLGRVLSDKSVIYGKDDYEAFEEYLPNTFGVTLSTLSQQYKVSQDEVIQTPVDVVFVLDVSGSMKNPTSKDNETRRQAVVSAVNEAMASLMKYPDNRVGIVLYSSGSWELLPLAHYTANSNGEYIVLNKSNNIVTANGLKNSNGDIAQTSGGSTQQNGTYTQAGIAQGYNTFSKVKDTTVNYTIGSGDTKRNITVTRQPVMILLSDGDPTHCTSNYMDVLNGPHYGSGVYTNTTNNRGIQGYYTILSANYYKSMIGLHYGVQSKFYTVGMGIYESGIGDLSEDKDGTASKTGDHYKRAVLNPTPSNISALTNTSAKNYKTTSHQLRDLLIGSYSEDYVTVDSTSKYSNLGTTQQNVPVLPNPYSSYSYADDALFGNISGAALEAFFGKIIDKVTTTNYGFILVNHSSEVIEDPIGDGMEVKGDPVLRYGGRNYTHTSKTINGNTTTYKYAYDYASPDGSGFKADLNDITVTITNNADGTQTVKMEVPDNVMPCYMPDISTPDPSWYYEQLPVRLIYQVGLTEKAEQELKEWSGGDGEKVFYTNKWSNTEYAKSTFQPMQDNPFYYTYQSSKRGTYYKLKDGTYTTVAPGGQYSNDKYESTTTKYKPVQKTLNTSITKTNNTTSTAKTSYAENWSGSVAEHKLGNNGKLVFEKPLVELKLVKVDQAGEPLPFSGVQFELYSDEELKNKVGYTKEGETDLTYIYETDDSGELVIPGLTVGAEYWLKEIKAPAGYNIMPEAHSFTVESGTDNKQYAIAEPKLPGDQYLNPAETAEENILQVINSSGYELPKTGGTGTTLYYISGSLLAGFALIYGCFAKQKKREGRHVRT